MTAQVQKQSTSRDVEEKDASDDAFGPQLIAKLEVLMFYLNSVVYIVTILSDT